MQSGQDQTLFLSLSFNTYSSTSKVAEIAVKVVEEQQFSDESDSEFDDAFDFDECDYFEFPSVCRETDASPISADDIFCNGHIRPTLPIFNGDFFFENSKPISSLCPASIRLHLRTLLFEERDPLSTSSSESDDLHGIIPGTYCVWRSESTATTRSRCRKGKSTGLAKLWSVWTLSVVVKGTFVFLPPSNGHLKTKELKALREQPRGRRK